MDERTRASIDAYDAAAAAYLAAWRDLRPREAARTFARMAGKGALVLDVAGGPGVDVRLLRDAGVRSASGDLAAECVKVARTYFPKGLLARWDFRHLPFADRQFEGIWAPAALQHLPRAGIIPALRELRRVHARGPIFLEFIEGRSDLEPFEDDPVGTVYVTRVTGDELKALLLKAGYRDVEIDSRPDPRGRRIRWVHGWGRLER